MRITSVLVWRAVSAALAVTLGLVLLGGSVFGGANAADPTDNWKDVLIARVSALETLTTAQGQTIASLNAALTQ